MSDKVVISTVAELKTWIGKDVDAKTILLTWGVTGEIEGGDKPILIAESLSRRSA